MKNSNKKNHSPIIWIVSIVIPLTVSFLFGFKIDGFEMNTFFESTNFQFKNSKFIFFSSLSKSVTNDGVAWIDLHLFLTTIIFIQKLGVHILIQHRLV